MTINISPASGVELYVLRRLGFLISCEGDFAGFWTFASIAAIDCHYAAAIKMHRMA